MQGLLNILQPLPSAKPVNRACQQMKISCDTVGKTLPRQFSLQAVYQQTVAKENFLICVT